MNGVREEGGGMPSRRASWIVVLRLTVVLTAAATLVVLASGTALWLIEGDLPNSTIRSWGDALWWSLSTLTTVGYGDHVPVTMAGRLIAAGVMVVGVAVIGAVAAIVALLMAVGVAHDEEQAFEAEAAAVERRVVVHLDRIEARLAGIEDRLTARSTSSVNDSSGDGREAQ